MLNQVLTIRVGLCTYMRYTQGQNEEHLAIQEHVLNQVHTIRVGLCT